MLDTLGIGRRERYSTITDRRDTLDSTPISNEVRDPVVVDTEEAAQ